MQITQEQLASCIGNNPYLDHWCEALNKLLPDYGIDTPQRVADRKSTRLNSSH